VRCELEQTDPLAVGQCWHDR